MNLGVSLEIEFKKRMNLLSDRAIGLVAAEFFQGMGQSGQDHSQVFP
jgi:hypothetical protein